MRIKEEFKKSGYFWLPSVPERKVPGILSISDGGNIDLEIIELLDHKTERLFNHSLKRIVGYIEEDEFVTLDDCSYKGGNLASIGLSKSAFRITRIFSRVQYDQDEIPSFNTLTFSVEGIDDWVETSGIKVEYPSEKCPAIISYEPQEDISFNLDNDMQLLITWRSSLKHSINKEAGISENIYFKLVSKESLELDEFVSVARKITEFLCFATNKIVCLDSISATSDDLFKEIEGGKSSPIHINIYYASWPYSKDEPEINWYNMLFRFKEIRNDIEEVITNWVKSYKQYDSAFRLYFLAKMGAQTYLEEKFLTLAQGLEAYHQRIVSKQVRLEDRITSIIKPFKDLIGIDENQQELIDSIVSTRHYLTHPNPSKKLKAAKGVNLWPLCMKMELLLELYFLQLMGFSREKIDSVVANCAQLKRKCAL